MLNFLERFRGAELLDHRLVLANPIPVLQGRLHDLAAVHVGVTLDITVDRVEQRWVDGNADLRAPPASRRSCHALTVLLCVLPIFQVQPLGSSLQTR